jgi:hypothetical protein
VDLIQIHDLEFSVSLEQVRIISAMKTFYLNDSLESLQVLWIQIGFNADPDPDTDTAFTGSGFGSCSDFPTQKC